MLMEFLKEKPLWQDFYGVVLRVEITLVIHVFGEIMNAFSAMTKVANNHFTHKK